MDFKPENSLNLQNLGTLKLKAAEIESGGRIYIDCDKSNPNDVLKDTYLVVKDHVILEFHMCRVQQEIQFFKKIIMNSKLEANQTNDQVLKRKLNMTIKHTQIWLDSLLD